MNENEAQGLRRELTEFKTEWERHHRQVDDTRRKTIMWGLGVAAGFAIPCVIWVWFVTTGASDGKEAAAQIPAIQANRQDIVALMGAAQRREGDSARITRLETIVEILPELRRSVGELQTTLAETNALLRQATRNNEARPRQ